MANEVRTSPDSRSVVVAENRTKISNIASSTEVKPWRPLAKKLTGEKAVALWDASKQLAQQDAFRESGMVELHRSAAKAIKKAPEKVKAELGYEISMEIIANLNAAENGDAQAVDRIKADVQAADFLGVESGIPNMRVLLSTARQVYEVPKVVQEGKRISRRAVVAGLAIGIPAVALTATAGGIAAGIMLGKFEGAEKPAEKPNEAKPAETPPSTEIKSPPTRPAPSPSPFAPPSPGIITEPPKEIPKTPEKPINIGEKFLEPFLREALERRKARDHEGRIDKELNADRLNILMYGYGEEHGATYADQEGSISFVSLSTSTANQANINLSRDIRCPEEEQDLPEDQKRPMVIRSVYRNGGFERLRKVAERATGLSADFQVVLKDVVIRDFIKDIVGTIKVPVDKPHKTMGYRLGGKDYPKGSITQGLQEMDAEKAMQYILAEDENPGGKEDERSYRKNILMKAIKEKFFEDLKNPLKAPLLIKRSLDFYNDRIASGDIVVDFDNTLLQTAAWGVLNVVKEMGMSLGQKQIVFPSPEISKSASVHDAFWGDGSVSRVHNIKAGKNRQGDSPEIKADIQRQFMPDWMLVPDGGNPYSKNLIQDYWGAIRKLVKAKLTS